MAGGGDGGEGRGCVIVGGNGVESDGGDYDGGLGDDGSGACSREGGREGGRERKKEGEKDSGLGQGHDG